MPKLKHETLTIGVNDKLFPINSEIAIQALGHPF